MNFNPESPKMNAANPDDPPPAPAVPGSYTMTHVAAAPRSLVFEVRTKAEHYPRWFSPKGLKTVIRGFDLRPGGKVQYGMQFPDGNTMWGVMTFREIVEPEKLVYVTTFADEEGRPMRSTFSATWPLEVLWNLTLADHPQGTLMTMESRPLNPSDEELQTFVAAQESMRKCAGEMLEVLDAYLAELTAGRKANA